MAASDLDEDESEIALASILRRITAQRLRRYGDAGPDLAPFGSARFSVEGSRLLVAYADISAKHARGAAGRVLEFSQPRGLRVIWNVVTDGQDGIALSQALRARGFTLDERLILMARQGKLQSRPNPDVSISRIMSWTAMRDYEYGSRRSFYGEDIPDDDLVTARARERWRQQEMGWYRYYTATVRGHFVGGLYVSLWEDVPTLMGVYTLSQARQRGVATSAMAYVIDELIASGRQTYCLFVKDDNPARALYHSLGFRALATEETYQSGS